MREFPGDLYSKESACHAGDQGSIPGSGQDSLKKEWLPTPVFLPGELNGSERKLRYMPSLWKRAVCRGKVSDYTIIEISSGKLEIPREHFMQRWAQ